MRRGAQPVIVSIIAREPHDYRNCNLCVPGAVSPRLNELFYEARGRETGIEPSGSMLSQNRRLSASWAASFSAGRFVPRSVAWPTPPLPPSPSPWWGSMSTSRMPSSVTWYETEASFSEGDLYRSARRTPFSQCRMSRIVLAWPQLSPGGLQVHVRPIHTSWGETAQRGRTTTKK